MEEEDEGLNNRDEGVGFSFSSLCLKIKSPIWFWLPPGWQPSVHDPNHPDHHLHTAHPSFWGDHSHHHHCHHNFYNDVFIIGGERGGGGERELDQLLPNWWWHLHLWQWRQTRWWCWLSSSLFSNIFPPGVRGSALSLTSADDAGSEWFSSVRHSGGSSCDIWQ